MFRCASLSACGALLLAFLVFLPSRSALIIPFDPTYPYLELPVASERGDSGPDVGCPVVSLNKNGQWTIAGVGPVSEDRLHKELIAERNAAHAFGVTAWVNVRIGARESAIHVSRFFQIAEACELDGVRIAVWEPAKTKKG